MNTNTKSLISRGSVPILILFVLLFSIPSVAYATDEVETFTLTFSEDDYVISSNDIGQIVIDPKGKACYPEDNQPGLPLSTMNIAIDGKYAYESVGLSFEKREILSDVELAPAPQPISTDEIDGGSTSENPSYDLTLLYPDRNCQYAGRTEWGGIGLLHFLLTPFSYDAKEKKLYFIDAIKLDINLSEETPKSTLPLTETNLSLLRSITYNPDFIDDYLASRPDLQSIDLNDRIDYVIITNKNLAPSFKPLRVWKTEKGFYSQILTTEEIEQNYTGNDRQHKIKNCIYDLYRNHGLKYVLLGGDDSIVPVRGCYGQVSAAKGIVEDKTIPTDMYYACFDGDFEWDKNKNGIYGEFGDGVSLVQHVYVTRVPVYTSTDVDLFVNRQLEYEQNPSFNNNILMAGVNLLSTGSATKSDAEMQGDKIYTNYIQPYWDGIRYKFYDTNTDFTGGSSYEVNANNLKSQMGKGYSFIEVLTHGSQTSWKMEVGKDYDTTYGKQQSNVSHSIVTTTACYTNGFDISNVGSEDPCLCESLIRNPNSGVIAYLGCSRKGWGYEKDYLGASQLYDGAFYERLFSNNLKDKNFGALVAQVKGSFISNCTMANAYRWVQFGLNPIGDPEMPIWTAQPKTFDDINFTLTNEGVEIDTGLDGCRICITDEWDHGEGYFRVYDNVQHISVSDIPEEASVCVTKYGYIPKQIKINILQNKNISSTRNFSRNVVVCGSTVSSNIKTGEFVIKNGKTTIRGNTVILGPGTKVEAGGELRVIKYE